MRCSSHLYWTWNKKTTKRLHQLSYTHKKKLLERLDFFTRFALIEFWMAPYTLSKKRDHYSYSNILVVIWLSLPKKILMLFCLTSICLHFELLWSPASVKLKNFLAQPFSLPFFWSLPFSDKFVISDEVANFAKSSPKRCK